MTTKLSSTSELATAHSDEDAKSTQENANNQMVWRDDFPIHWANAQQTKYSEDYIGNQRHIVVKGRSTIDPFQEVIVQENKLLSIIYMMTQQNCLD